MSAIRLCRECKHLEGGERCKAPQNSEDRAPDFVNGFGNAKRIIWYGAQFCREDEKACGKEARWFEPREEKSA